MFLTLFLNIRDGNPPTGPEIIQSGRTHVLREGAPDDLYLYAMRQAERLAARAGKVSSTVIRVRDTGHELSYGAWWPLASRRLDKSLAAGWPARLHIVHTFPDGVRMGIMIAPQHNRVVVLFQTPGHADDMANLTMRNLVDGTIESMVYERGLLVVA